MMYRIAEGQLTLDAEWQDQSINVLLPKQSSITGVNLVIARDRLPLGLTFAGYVDQQRQTFRAQLAKLDMIADSAGTIDGREAHFLEFAWHSDGKPVHQVMAMVLREDGGLLNFTGSIPGGNDAATRDMLIAAITAFRFAP